MGLMNHATKRVFQIGHLKNYPPKHSKDGDCTLFNVGLFFFKYFLGHLLCLWLIHRILQPPHDTCGSLSFKVYLHQKSSIKDVEKILQFFIRRFSHPNIKQLYLYQYSTAYKLQKFPQRVAAFLRTDESSKSVFYAIVSQVQVTSARTQFFSSHLMPFLQCSPLILPFARRMQYMINDPQPIDMRTTNRPLVMHQDQWLIHLEH